MLIPRLQILCGLIQRLHSVGEFISKFVVSQCLSRNFVGRLSVEVISFYKLHERKSFLQESKIAGKSCLLDHKYKVIKPNNMYEVSVYKQPLL